LPVGARSKFYCDQLLTSFTAQQLPQRLLYNGYYNLQKTTGLRLAWLS
jgi:hypothetical protein